MRSSQTVKNLLPRVQKEHILPFHKTLRRIIKYTQTRGVIPLQSINTYKEKQILCHNIYQAFHLLSSRITTIFICLRRYQSLPTVATQGDALLHTRANRIIFGFRWKNSDSVIKTSEWSRWLLRHIRTSRRLTWATRLYTVYSRFFSYFFFARGPILSSQNIHGSSSLCSFKYTVPRWWVPIKDLYLRTDFR